MVRSILRQPLLHFAVLGVLIFGAYELVNETPAETDRQSIVVSEQDATWLANQFRATWRRAPLPDELQALMEDFVREEIYVRQAIALGLDQGDTVVRRRLRQKMEFLTEAGAEAATPTDQDLKDHLASNAERFTIAPRLSFSQVMIPADAPGSGEGILEALRDGTPPEELGRPSLLPQSLSLSALQAVDGTFGNGFFGQLTALGVGVWSGPVTSGYGEHIVRVDAFVPERLPTLDEVREQVELDWRAEKARELRRARFDELRSAYEILLPNAQQVLEQ